MTVRGRTPSTACGCGRRHEHVCPFRPWPTALGQEKECPTCGRKWYAAPPLTAGGEYGWQSWPYKSADRSSAAWMVA